MSRGVKLRHGYYTVLVGEHDDLYHIFLQKFERLKNKLSSFSGLNWKFFFLVFTCE